MANPVTPDQVKWDDEVPAQPAAGSPQDTGNVTWDEDKYGSPGQQAIAGLEGVAHGVVGPLATGAERLLGVKPEDIRGREEENPITHGLGEAVGFGGAAYLTGGVSAEAREALEAGEIGAKAAQGTSTAAKLASNLTAPGLFGQLGEKAAAVAGVGGEGAGVASQIAESGIKTGAEMAALQASDETSKLITEDPHQSIGSAAINIGLSGILGATGGAALGAVSPLWRAALSKVGAAEKPVISEIDKAAVDSGDFAASINNSPNVPENEKQSILDGLRQQKGNAKDIISAANEIDAPILEGMTSANKWVQQGEDALINGAPTYSGVQRQAQYQKVYDAVKNVSDAAVGEGSPYSKAELGSVFKDSITKKIEDQVRPINALYDEIKQSYDAIPLSEKSAPAIARNISKLQEVRLSPSSPEAKLAARVVDEIGNLKTVDDIKNYKSILMRSVSPTASSGEKRMAGILADKLSDLEENSIIRFAQNEMKTPQAKEKILGLIEQRAQADAQYKDFRKSLNTLSEQLGKGRVYGAQDAISFIRDRLTPEDMVQKLFSKKDSEFLNFFSKSFPDEMQLMRDYQKGVIREAASKTGVLNPSAIFREVDKLEPEIQKAIFSPEELRKIEAAKTVYQSIPKAFNPSGTSHVSAFRAFFEHPTGAVVGNLRDAAISHFVRAAGGGAEKRTAEAIGRLSMPGKAEETKSTIDYIHNIIKGQNLLGRAANAIFTGAEVIPKHLIPTEDSRDKLQESLDSMEDMNQATNIGGKVRYFLPDHSTAAAVTAATAKKYLNSLKPTESKASPLDRPSPPDPIKQQKYNRALDIAQQPLMVLQYAKNGTLQAQDVKTLNTIYPNLHQQIIGKVFQEMTKDPDGGAKIPYKQRFGLSLLLGKPLDSSLTQQGMMTIAMANAPKSHPMQQPSAGNRGVSKSTAASQEKVNKMYATPNQAGAARRLGS